MVFAVHEGPLAPACVEEPANFHHDHNYDSNEPHDNRNDSDRNFHSNDQNQDDNDRNDDRRSGVERRLSHLWVVIRVMVRVVQNFPVKILQMNKLVFVGMGTTTHGWVG